MPEYPGVKALNRTKARMGPSIHIVPELPAPSVAPDADELADRAAASPNATTSAQTAINNRGRDPIGRFRRRIEQLRGDADAFGGADGSDEESDLKLELMLLREENARLKAERHRPSDVGTLIDQMRQVGAEKGHAEMADEAWTVLSECLVIREGLEQACVEIQAAIGAVHERLRKLAVGLDAPGANAAAADRARRALAHG
jgi:hypothetical protein